MHTVNQAGKGKKHIDRLKDKRIDRHPTKLANRLIKRFGHRQRQIGSQIYRLTDRYTDRRTLTCRQTDRKIGRQIDKLGKHTDGRTDRQISRQTDKKRQMQTGKHKSGYTDK